MELWQVIATIIVGLLALLGHQTSKRKDAEKDAKLAETKGKDAILKENQAEVEKQIHALDEGIKRMEKEREKAKVKDETPDERAKKWDK